jgi:hypothetical protein
MQGYGDGDIRRALTAAIGAAPKNDASAAIAEMRQTAKELRENAIGDCNAARQAIYWEGKADALEAAIGAGGQAVADGAEEQELDRLRLQAFKTNSNDDKAAYYLAVSKWFQDRHYRALSQPHPADERVVEALREARELLAGPLVGVEWKRACHSFVAKADAALSATEGRKNG